MPTALAIFFVRILTDESYLSISVLEEGSQSYKIQIGRNEKNCVAWIIIIKFVPNLLGKETEPCIINML